MAWVVPQHSRGRIDAAGDELVAGAQFETDVSGETWLAKYDEALQIINNWRSSHSYPLQVIKMSLLGRAKRIDESAIVAQRIKRLSSIATKLDNNSHMKLSKMQDLGGCRAIVRSVRQVRKVVRLCQERTTRDPHKGPELAKLYDYITNPKPDGYRSCHIVYKYRTSSEHRSIYNGLRVEVQIRSRLQHVWATAVETVGTFTQQALKSGLGDPAWRRFFALMGTALAMRERSPLVPDTPSSPSILRRELREITHRLHAVSMLEDLGTVLTWSEQPDPKAAAYLLELDSRKRTISITGFERTELSLASNRYLAAEQRSGSEGQAVLVAVSSLKALRSAYPNYYLDTRAFVAALRRAIAE